MPRARVGAVALASVLALIAVAMPAHADTEADLDVTRAAVDEIAQQWFETQFEVARLDDEIAALDEKVRDARARAIDLRAQAADHALDLYRGPSTAFLSVLDGADPLDSARRAEFLERAHADARRMLDDLNAVTEELDARLHELREQRESRTQLMEALSEQQAELDGRLAAIAARASAERRARSTASTGPGAPAPVPGGTTDPTPAPDPPPSPAPPPDAPPSDPAPDARPGRHPRHDHPFLACTRARESGGDYRAVNPAGYYGAYQFLPTTWNAAANRAGRLDLVGTLPSQASEYDQDELAWTLYQWQGKQPWGGRC